MKIELHRGRKKQSIVIQMGCAAFKKLWEKYENGTLTHDEQELLESHIETCEECEAYLDELL